MTYLKCLLALISISLLFLMGCKTTPIEAPRTQEDPNRPPVNTQPFKENLPEDYDRTRLAQVGDLLYFIGGGDHSGHIIHGRVRALNLKTGQWSDRDSMNVPRADFGVAIIGDAIYAIGGKNNTIHTEASRRVVERYDVAADRWTQLPPLDLEKMPGYDGLEPNGVAACNGKIYTVSTSRVAHTLTIYESADGEQWNPYQFPLPVGTEELMIASEEKLYIILRRRGDTANRMIEFDPATRTITEKREPYFCENESPMNRAFYFRGKIYLLNSVNSCPAMMQVYSIAENRWSIADVPYKHTDNRDYQMFFTDRASGEIYLTALPDVTHGFYFNAINGTFYTR